MPHSSAISHWLGAYKEWFLSKTVLHWRHSDYDGVSNNQPHGSLLNSLFRRRSKKTSKLRVTGLCVGNSPGPHTKGQLRGKCFHLMTSSWVCTDHSLPQHSNCVQLIVQSSNIVQIHASKILYSVDWSTSNCFQYVVLNIASHMGILSILHPINRTYKFWPGQTYTFQCERISEWALMVKSNVDVIQYIVQRAMLCTLRISQNYSIYFDSALSVDRFDSYGCGFVQQGLSLRPVCAAYIVEWGTR